MRNSFEPPPALPPKREKRYGWHRTYNDFIGHPKWRMVAKKSGVHLGFVTTIVQAMFCHTSKKRSRGWLRELDLEEISAATDVPIEDIASVYRTLEEIDWLVEDHIIDWPDRQPDLEDPTATERQRNRRARLKAKKALKLGRPLAPGQAELLSRVTLDDPPERPQERATEFVLVVPASDRVEAVNAAMVENERRARIWLLGDGHVHDYGPASRIVSDNLGMRRMGADGTVRRWLQEIGGDAIGLAEIISGADREAINGEAFKAVIEQRIKALMTLRTNGPKLPLGPAAIKGGGRRHG